MTQNNKWFDNNIHPDIGDVVVRINIILPKRVGTVTRDVRPDIEPNYENLEHQMEEIPSQLMFWSGLLSEHRAIVATLERMIVSREAKIAKETLEKIPDMSQWKVRTIIDADDTVNELHSKHIKVKKEESKLFDIVNALRTKSEMLRSLAGFKRQEYRDTK